MEYKIKIKETATLGDLSDLMAFLEEKGAKNIKHKTQLVVNKNRLAPWHEVTLTYISDKEIEIDTRKGFVGEIIEG